MGENNRKDVFRMLTLIYGLLLPFLGTALGAACVFFMKKAADGALRRMLTGFAAGVMTAASVWSLLIPAIDRSEAWGGFAFLPPTVGLWMGIGFLLLLDRVIPHLHFNGTAEGPKSPRKRSVKLMLSVTLHNLPEGMAVGVVLGGWLSGDAGISAPTVAALALGIALQNFPEGAIISLPLKGEGMSRPKAFLLGALSGIVEPIGALLTLCAVGAVGAVLPLFLGFAAGAMLFVVVEELIPEFSEGDPSDTGTLFFALGFSLMMALDVALG